MLRGHPLTAAFAATLDTLFPPRCAACGRVGRSAEGAFCVDCAEDLQAFDGPVCPRCATPFGAAPAREDCSECRGTRPPYAAVLAFGPYAGLLRRLVLEAKRPGGAPGANALGRKLAGSHAATLPAGAIVVPIPQHWTRRWGRGADGVESLARGFAAGAGLRVSRVLRRTRPTPRQTSVAPSRRRENVRGAFRVARPAAVRGQTVALVDDVFTTGATCGAAALALRRAGAARVVVVVAARRVATA